MDYKALVEAFKELDTTCVSDALDRLGLPGGLLGIKSLFGGQKICGPAFTVHYVPCGEIKGTVGDFLDDVDPGQVIVIDNSGRCYCTVWGDIMAVVAAKKGVEGTLIDGVCRDVDAIRRTGYPLFTKGSYMVTGKDRVEVDGVNVPVAVSGVRVCPGDIVLGDDTGAVIIPRDRAEEVLRIAREVDETEQKIIAAISEGSTLREARERLNYHHLQTRVN